MNGPGPRVNTSLPGVAGGAGAEREDRNRGFSLAEDITSAYRPRKPQKHDSTASTPPASLSRNRIRRSDGSRPSSRDFPPMLPGQLGRIGEGSTSTAARGIQLSRVSGRESDSKAAWTPLSARSTPYSRAGAESARTGSMAITKAYTTKASHRPFLNKSSAQASSSITKSKSRKGGSTTPSSGGRLPPYSRPSTRKQRSAKAASSKARVYAENEDLIPMPTRGGCSCWGPEFTSPTEVAPGIFIGNREDAQAPTRLKSLNIRFILNAAAQLPNFLEDDPHFRYLKLDIYDKESENITPHFSKAIAFIHRAQQKGQGCMIHCIAGVSRSVALTIAYLMHKKRERLLTVMKRVVKLRPIAMPNTTFRYALARYELELFGDSSVNNTTERTWDFFKWNSEKLTHPRHIVKKSKCIIC